MSPDSLRREVGAILAIPNNDLLFNFRRDWVQTSLEMFDLNFFISRENLSTEISLKQFLTFLRISCLDRDKRAVLGTVPKADEMIQSHYGVWWLRNLISRTTRVTCLMQTRKAAEETKNLFNHLFDISASRLKISAPHSTNVLFTVRVINRRMNETKVAVSWSGAIR